MLIVVIATATPNGGIFLHILQLVTDFYSTLNGNIKIQIRLMK